MRKNIILVGVLAFGTFTAVNAQTGRVGINTDTPQSTLDVRGKTDADGKSLATDMTGLQAPRLTREELTLKGNTFYGSNQKGALIYITDVSLGTAISQRVNVTTPGYYYFDGAFWQKFVDTDTAILPTGFERRPDMTATNFYWRLIGADATKYGTEGKYGLDATWNPSDFNETVNAGGTPITYNTLMNLGYLSTSDLGARGKNSFTSGAVNSASGNISTALGAGNASIGDGSFAAGLANHSEGHLSAAIGRENWALGIASFAAGNGNRIEATGASSVAMGVANIVNGENAIAMGQQNEVDAQGAVGIGNTNKVTNVSAFAMGQQNTASGQGSLAIGNTNTTSDTSGVAIGQSNIVSAPAAVAIGNSNDLSTAADSSLALGFTNTVSGASSFAIGDTNTLSALRTFAMGSNNNVTGQYAKAFGYSLTAPSQFSTSLGLYNTDEILPQSAAYSDLTKRLFVIGNGTGTSAKSDALTILRNGKTGLSQSVPTETLDVGKGNVRVRDINSNPSTDPTDKYVMADANGVLKVASLFVPKTSLVGFRTTATGNITANTSANVIFTTNPLLSGFTYDSTTGVYTSGNAGYYQISVTVAKDISMNNPSGGTSIVRLLVNGSVVNAVSNGFLDGSQGTNQNMTYVVYLNTGDTFNFNTFYTRTSRITNAQVSVIAMGG